ncbi:MAG: hypothetical protein GKR91_06960 [Pseudomonadales bacterium]|nr:hypothetical protein [Pseudomonadales bacterium]
MQLKDSYILILSATVGFFVCLIISVITGSNEAFDSPVYFRIGIPLMCIMIALIAWFFPNQPWRWVVSMGTGQFIAILLGGNSLSLWPIAIVFMALLSIPQLITALAVAWISRRNKGAQS